MPESARSVPPRSGSPHREPGTVRPWAGLRVVLPLGNRHPVWFCHPGTAFSPGKGRGAWAEGGSRVAEPDRVTVSEWEDLGTVKCQAFYLLALDGPQVVIYVALCYV